MKIPVLALLLLFSTNICNGDQTSTETSVSTTPQQKATCDNDPQTVSDIIVTPSAFNVTLTWKDPNVQPPPCEVSYNIYVDGILRNTTKELEATIEDLDACESYEIGVAILFDDNRLGDVITYNTITTQPSEGTRYTVEDVTIALISSAKILNITWEAPAHVAKCVTEYHINFWDHSDLTNYNDTITDALFCEINPVVGCMTYDVQVTPRFGSNDQNGSPPESFIVEALPTSPPRFVSDQHAKTSANLSVEIDQYKENMCVVSAVFVTCSAPSDFDWTQPFAETHYSIENDGKDRVTDLTIPVEDLSPFTDYTCSAIVLNSAGNSTTSQEYKFRTDEDVPSEPIGLQLLETESTTFTISWEAPNKVPGIMLQYNIFVEDQGPNYVVPSICSLNRTNLNDTVSRDNFNITFFNLSPAFKYRVTVSGEDGAGEGPSNSISLTTNTFSPSPPEKLEHLNDTIASITWETSCSTNGPLAQFNLSVTSYYCEDKICDDNSIQIFYETHPKNSDPNNITYEHQLTDPKPSHIYEINVAAVLEDGTNGEMATTSLTTPDALPDAPSLGNLDSATSAGFRGDFEPPSERKGKILHYNVTIIPVGPLYTVPEREECRLSSTALKIQTEASEREFLFEGGIPYNKYRVYVQAETSAGFGAESNEGTIDTSESKPDPVEAAQLTPNYPLTEDYSAYATITFESPCRMNGEFTNYTINSTRTKDSVSSSKIFNTTGLCLKVDLEPESDYSFSIMVYTAAFSSTEKSLESFLSNPGVPKLGNIKVPNPIANSTSVAYLELPNYVFDDTNGMVRYYAIFLLPGNTTLQQSFGFWDGTPQNWPPLITETNNATSLTEIMWNPFSENQTSVPVVIGSGTNGSEKLKPNRQYTIIIRGLTSATYRDYPPLVFRTKPEEVLDESNLGLILGLIFGLLFLAAVGALIYLYWKRRQRRQYTNKEIKRDSLHQLSASMPRPITCKKFPAYYDFLENNHSELKSQFSSLDTLSAALVVNSSTVYATLLENKRKNRYSNILPYDETRVRLKIDEDHEISSDYINASYIKGYSGNVEYIATQGPLKTTCRDFWKMIIQENVTLIVMVSQFVELTKEKCYRYLPNNHEKDTFDDIEVECTTELHFGTSVVRTLTLTKDKIQKTVTHMQFLDWPDFGVPSGTGNVLQFARQIRGSNNAQRGLIAVHCSAGVGRTGTIIAVDMLLQTIENKEDINIFKLVLGLRKQRINMVQTEKQYMFIYTCVKDSLVPQSPREKSEPRTEKMSILRTSSQDNPSQTDTESAL